MYHVRLYSFISKAKNMFYRYFSVIYELGLSHTQCDLRIPVIFNWFA